MSKINYDSSIIRKKSVDNVDKAVYNQLRHLSTCCKKRKHVALNIIIGETGGNSRNINLLGSCL